MRGRASFAGLTWGDYKVLAVSLVAQIKHDDVPSLAAGVAFRIFLSLFPALFAAVAAFSLVASGEDIVALVGSADVLPAAAQEQIEGPLIEFVERAGGGARAAVIGGILGGVWTASSAAVMLARALTRIFGAPETRSFLAQRITGVVIALALFVALVLLVLLLVAGATLQSLALASMRLRETAEAGLATGLTVGRYVLAVGVLIFLFAFVYWRGPDRAARPRFEWLTPGSFFGVVGWLVVSTLFGLYTQTAGAAENPAYAGLGGVIVLLLWLQVTMVILLIGAELNAQLRLLQAARIVTGHTPVPVSPPAAAGGADPHRDRQVERSPPTTGGPDSHHR